MTRANRNYPRQADEEYNTPAWVGTVIAQWLKQQDVRQLWDPAPGDGRFADTLREHGFFVAETLPDFLMRTTWPTGVDALVTNPPFGKRGELAEAFAHHALEIGAPIVALLLRVDFDSGKTRQSLFKDCPYFAGKIVLLDRIVWFERKGAAPSENHAWFIWDRAYRGRPWIQYAQRDVL